VARKPAASRSLQDLRLVRAKLSAVSRFFSELPLDAQTAVARNFTHAYRRKGELLVKQGGEAVEFYILLRGSCSVWLQTEEAREKVEREYRDVFRERQSIKRDNVKGADKSIRLASLVKDTYVVLNMDYVKHHPSVFRGPLRTPEDKGVVIEVMQNRQKRHRILVQFGRLKGYYSAKALTPCGKVEDDRSPIRNSSMQSRARMALMGMSLGGSDVEHLALELQGAILATRVCAGDPIGDVALTSATKIRGASVVVEEDVELLVLKDSVFQTQLAQHCRKKRAEVMEFLRECVPGFDSPAAKKGDVFASKTVHWFRPFHAGRGEVLAQKGGKTDKLIVIKEGRAAAVMERVAPTRGMADTVQPAKKTVDAIEFTRGAMIGGLSVALGEIEELQIEVRSARLTGFYVSALEFKQLPKTVMNAICTAQRRLAHFRSTRLGDSSQLWVRNDEEHLKRLNRQAGLDSRNAWVTRPSPQLLSQARPGSAQKMAYSPLEIPDRAPAQWAKETTLEEHTPKYGDLLRASHREWSSPSLSRCNSEELVARNIIRSSSARRKASPGATSCSSTEDEPGSARGTPRPGRGRHLHTPTTMKKSVRDHSPEEEDPAIAWPVSSATQNGAQATGTQSARTHRAKDPVVGLWQQTLERDAMVLRDPAVGLSSRGGPAPLPDRQAAFLGVLHDITQAPMPPLKQWRVPPRQGGGSGRPAAGGVGAARAARRRQNRVGGEVPSMVKDTGVRERRRAEQEARDARFAAELRGRTAARFLGRADGGGWFL